MKHTIYSPERVFQDPNYSSKLREADVATIAQNLQSMLGVKLSDLTSGRIPLATLNGPLQCAKSGQYAPSHILISMLNCWIIAQTSPMPMGTLSRIWNTSAAVGRHVHWADTRNGVRSRL